MRLVILSLAALLTGCTAMLLGGGNERAPQNRSATELSADVRTTTAVRDRLGADGALARYSIGVSTYQGRVTLTGSVETHSARNRAATLARGIEGVVSVDNRIRVRPAD